MGGKPLSDGGHTKWPETEPVVEFRGVSKTYDGLIDVIAGLNLNVRRGEFMTFLGPSGSGKTTALMLLAGFEQPTLGSIFLEGREISRQPPHRRGMGVVFQSYALFPHLSIRDNIAFPLHIRSVSADECNREVDRALAMTKLEGMADRKPGQLSGGQQQRAALARALVFKPPIILLDEPLGALDKNLREEMQTEIKALHRSLRVTMVYVTHDQTEALTMSDRVAVFERGRIRQLASPRELYDNPANLFVARFFGENNVLTAKLASRSEVECVVTLPDGTVTGARPTAQCAVGDKVALCVRPEALSMCPQGASPALRARVIDTDYLGDHLRIRCKTGDGSPVFMRADTRAPTTVPRNGEEVVLTWNPADAYVLPLPSEIAS
jgi:putative spermidine/putrescine transport system ATP-binding protein